MLGVSFEGFVQGLGFVNVLSGLLFFRLTRWDIQLLDEDLGARESVTEFCKRGSM